jgi:predicted transposase/invertase (TIGR01784 family)
MKPDEIGQPHDRLVKQVFGRKETAARLLQAYLPPKLAEALHWSRLELRPGSFVDAKLRHEESDLLFYWKHCCATLWRQIVN